MVITSDRFSAILKGLGWSPADLAERLEISEVTVRRYCNGRMVAPPHLAAWLIALDTTKACYLAQHPVPEGWFDEEVSG